MDNKFVPNRRRYVYKKHLDIFSLIEKVKEQPLLYDVNVADYNNVPVRDKAWQEISDHFGVSAHELKVKWGSLRSSFRRELKIRNAKKMRGLKKIRQWRYSKSLEFLLPQLQFDGSTSNDCFDEVATSTSTFNKIDKIEISEAFVDCSNVKSEIEPHSDASIVTDEASLVNFDDEKNLVQSANDPLAQFFAGMLATTRTFPTEWQIKAKMAIFQEVSKLELELVQREDL